MMLAGLIIPYTYGDANWKDKLTAYDGKAITYDAIGNPLSDGTWSYTWQAGRQLKQMSKSGTTVQFMYDHNGLRTRKTVTTNGTAVATYYTLHGKNIVHVIKNSDHLHIFYDAQNRPAKVSFNGTFYTYLHNLQGDVVGLVDKDGALVVEYKYDAWGKPLSITGTLANTLGKFNPFRYRGYVYDEETGLYYLRSRYYNPAWGRFINADFLISSSFNQYTYCGNRVVYMRDPDGNEFFEIYWDESSNRSFSSIFSLADFAGYYIGNTNNVSSTFFSFQNTSRYEEAWINSPYNNTTQYSNRTSLDAASSTNPNISPKTTAKATVVCGQETKAPTVMKESKALEAWNAYLGPNQTHRNPFTGEIDNNRIFGVGTNLSIRMAGHEMSSLGTNKAHFHVETWIYDDQNNVYIVDNLLRRVK